MPKPNVTIRYEVLGHTIRAPREELGLNMRELATRAGVGQTTIWQYERGRQQMPLHLLPDLARALEVDRAYLTDAVWGKE